jgi:hypothetical protein
MVSDPVGNCVRPLFKSCGLVSRTNGRFFFCLFGRRRATDAGQTASGKTHTMSGSIEDETMMGVLPRTVKRLFQLVAQSERNLECVRIAFVCCVLLFLVVVNFNVFVLTNV